LLAPSPSRYAEERLAAAAAPGRVICCPTCRPRALTPGLALIRAVREMPLAAAMPERVSPARTVIVPPECVLAALPLVLEPAAAPLLEVPTLEVSALAPGMLSCWPG